MTGPVHALPGYAGRAAYAAAKEGLVQSFTSPDYGLVIRTYTILARVVVTNVRGKVEEVERTRIINMCPLPRNGQSEDVGQQRCSSIRSGLPHHGPYAVCGWWLECCGFLPEVPPKKAPIVASHVVRGMPKRGVTRRLQHKERLGP